MKRGHYLRSTVRLFLAASVIVVSTANASEFVPFGDFPDPDGNPPPNNVVSSSPLAISDNGAYVVGLVGIGSVSFIDLSPVLWSADGTQLSLDDDTSEVTPHGVTNDGAIVVGDDFLQGPLFEEALVWTAETGFVPIAGVPPSDGQNEANDITSDGRVIVGKIGQGVSGSFSEAYRWTSETGPIGLGDLPGGQDLSRAHAVSADGNAITGSSGSERGIEGFYWTESTGMIGLGDLPGGLFSSTPHNISANGNVVVGSSSSLETVEEAFRWTLDGGIEGLGMLPGSIRSSAIGANQDGSVIVGGAVGTGRRSRRAFVWDSVHGTRDFQEVLINEYDLESTLAGWILETAIDISADGLSIVGTGTNPDGNSESWLVRLDHPINTPEPSTLALLACGTLAVYCRLR